MLQESTNRVILTSSWPRAIAHVDADAFFVACEQALNPSLRNKPVAVGKERGIITALSYEAKARGIKRGDLVWQAKKSCPDLIVLESNYETYSLFSIRLFEILRRFSPVVEEYSIDEAFVDLQGLRRLYACSYEQLAKKIQDTIEKELSLSVSIGVSITKTLAKIASKYIKPHGITAISGKHIHLYLDKIPIEDVWGIGPNTASLLKKLNIRTALDFVYKDESYLSKYLSKPYMQTYKELKGIPAIEFTTKAKNKSISKQQSFSATNNKEYIYSELLKNLELSCAKARRFGLAARKIVVSLRTKDFRFYSLEVKLSSSTNAAIVLSSILRKAFEELYIPNTYYTQTGILLLELSEKTQYSLFDDAVKIEKIERLYNAIDKINERFGKGFIHLGPSAYPKKEKTLNLPVLDITLI